MEYTFKPEKKFDGSITMKLLKRKERQDILKKLNVKQNEDGSVDINENVFASSDMIEEAVRNSIVKVDLVLISDTEIVITNLDQLEYYEEYEELLGQMSTIILKGAPLGNGSRVS